MRCPTREATERAGPPMAMVFSVWGAAVRHDRRALDGGGHKHPFLGGPCLRAWLALPARASAETRDASATLLRPSLRRNAATGRQLRRCAGMAAHQRNPGAP